MAKPKFGYPSLALLDWVCEKGPDRRLFTSGGRSSRGIYLFEASKPDAAGKRKLTRVWPISGRIDDDPKAQALIDRLGGRDHVDYSAMYQAGFFTSFNVLGHSTSDTDRGKLAFEAFVEKLDRNYFHFSESAVIPTPLGFDYWRDHGRAAAASMLAERQAKAAAVSRTVLIGGTVTVGPRLPRDLSSRIPRDVSLPLPSQQIVVPYAMAVVVRETGNRLYVRDVRKIPHVGDDGWRDRVIQGNAPHQYIEASAVMVDGCTPDLADRLSAISGEFQADVDAIGAKIVTDMLPGLIDMSSRVKQKDAERSDAVADAMRAAGHAVPSPSDDVPQAASGAFPRPK